MGAVQNVPQIFWYFIILHLQSIQSSVFPPRTQVRTVRRLPKFAIERKNTDVQSYILFSSSIGAICPLYLSPVPSSHPKVHYNFSFHFALGRERKRGVFNTFPPEKGVLVGRERRREERRRWWKAPFHSAP